MADTIGSNRTTVLGVGYGFYLPIYQSISIFDIGDVISLTTGDRGCRQTCLVSFSSDLSSLYVYLKKCPNDMPLANFYFDLGIITSEVSLFPRRGCGRPRDTSVRPCLSRWWGAVKLLLSAVDPGLYPDRWRFLA